MGRGIAYPYDQFVLFNADDLIGVDDPEESSAGVDSEAVWEDLHRDIEHCFELDMEPGYHEISRMWDAYDTTNQMPSRDVSWVGANDACLVGIDGSGGTPAIFAIPNLMYLEDEQGLSDEEYAEWEHLDQSYGVASSSNEEAKARRLAEFEQYGLNTWDDVAARLDELTKKKEDGEQMTRSAMVEKANDFISASFNRLIAMYPSGTFSRPTSAWTASAIDTF